MLSNMAYQTNLYTTQKNVKSINTDAKELEQLTGVYLRMGLVKMPNQRSYWETFSVYTGVSSIFSRKRFETLMSSIHFVDNNSVTEETKKNKKKTKDKLWKSRSWISSLRQNFLEISPEKFNAVDEIMVPFKGKSILRQHMPKKPHKWGFKIWGRSDVSGLLYDFDICQGKSNKKFQVI